MTSTVLDVTVLLLCVSAGVVVLGASDAGAPDGPTATDAADRLVTETVTVTYRDGDAPNGTRRVHATRAELLALLVERDANGAFDGRAVEAVRAGLGPRTRADATVRGDDEADGDTAAAPERIASASSPVPSAGGAVPARVIGEPDRSTSTTESRKRVAVGPKPPRNADVAVAVVRQPIPGRSVDGPGREGGSAGVVRIVVRRW
ncbi:hypothetical protein [Halorubrum ejinorense]